MENKSSLGSAHVDGVFNASVGGVSLPSQAPSPQGFQSQITPPAPVPAPRPRRKRPSLATIAIFVGIALLALGFVVWMLWPSSDNDTSQISRFERTQIDLGQVPGGNYDFQDASDLTILGQLNLSGSFAIAPSSRPASPKTGQLYYDQATNLLSYYNGSSFVDLGGPQNIQVGDGLANTDGVLSNSGVLSVQGLTGAVTLTAGDGITISGATISVDPAGAGVLSLTSGSPSLNISSDGNGNLTITGTAGGGNVHTGGGTAGRLAVFTGVDTIADSIVSQSGTALTVGGDLVTTGSINGQAISSNANFTGTVTVANGLTLATGTLAVNGGNIATAGDLAVNGGDITSTGGLTVTASSGNITLNANGTIALQDSTSITGDLTISGSLSLGTSLGVPSGGTGANSLTANGVLVGQGTGAITAVTAGGSGMCLKSTAGAPVFDTCVTNSAAVTDLNGLTGSLTIANATGSVDTITINDAGTTQKGIAQFSSTNFTANSGNINTVQNIHTGATPTFAGLTLNGTLNMDANSISGSNFSIQGNTGNLSTSGTITSGLINGQTISSNANFTGTVTITGDLAVNGGDITSTGALSVTTGGALTLGTSGNDDLELQTNGSTRLSIDGGTGDLLATSSLTLQGGTITVGTTSQAGTLVLHDGDGETATIQIDLAGLTSNQTYTLPDDSGEICLNTGNCAGGGTGVTSTVGGTANRLAKFTAAQNIEDSTISDDGTNVTTSVDVIIQGGDLTVGTTSQLASLVMHDGDGETTTLRAGNSTGDLTFILPTNTGSANQCLKQSGSGNQLVWDACDGGGGGVSATLQNAYDNGNTISTSNARDITITLSDTTTDSNFNVVVADGSTSFVSFTRANGTGTADPSQLLLIDNLDTDRAIAAGIKLQAAAGGMTVAIDATDAEIVDALNVASNNIVGTTGNIDFTNFDVVGATGNITTAGDLAVNGGDITSTGGLTLLANSGNISLNASGTLELLDNTNITGSLDVSGTLALGTSNALTVDSSGNITTGGTLAVNGGSITSTGTLTIGTTSQTLSLVGNDSTSLSATDSGNTTTLVFATPADTTTLVLPTLPAGSYEICTDGGNCFTGTLQDAYDNSSNPEIVLSGATGALTILDNGTPLGGHLLEIQSNDGATTYLAVTANGIEVTGDIEASGDISTTTGELVINSQTRIDNSGNLLNIGNLTATDAITIASTGAGNDITLDSADDIILDSTGAIQLLGDTVQIGNLTVQDASTATKSYRFRTDGSNLDLEGAGAHLYISVFDNADFTGTQRNKLVLERNSEITRAIGTWQFRTDAEGTIRHIIDGSTGAGIVFNENGEATDFRVEGDSDTGLLFIQGSTDRVGIGTTSPGSKLDVNGTFNASGNTTFGGTINTNTFTGSALTFGDSSTATISAATSQALDIVAHGTSSWATDSGNLTIDTTASSGILNLGTGSQSKTVNIGSTTTTSTTNIRAGTGGISIVSGANIVLGASDTTGTLLVLDAKTDSGDPTGVNGAMYYNSNLGKFRCYEAGAWTDCIYGPPIGTINMFAGSSAPSGWLICDGSAVSRTTYASLFAVIGTTYGAGNGSTTFNLPDFRARMPVGAGTGTKVLTFSSRSGSTITVTGANNTSDNEIQTGTAVVYATTGSNIGGLTPGTYYLIRQTNTSFQLATSRANALAGSAVTLSSSGSGTRTFTITVGSKTLGNTGGEETHSLTTNEIPAHDHTVSGTTSTDGDHTHSIGADGVQSGSSTGMAAMNVPGNQAGNGGFNNVGTAAAGSHNHTVSGTAADTGGSEAHNNLSPFTVVNYIIRY